MVGINTNLDVDELRNYWWNGWEALRGFQDIFPVVHEKLIKQASDERLAAKRDWLARKSQTQKLLNALPISQTFSLLWLRGAMP